MDLVLRWRWTVEPRTIDKILEEWRQRERELEEDPDADLEALHSRIMVLRDEHMGALEKRAPEAQDLRRPGP